MWTKVEFGKGRGTKGNQARQGYAVGVYGKNAKILIPGRCAPAFDRVDIYSSGDGKVALHSTPKGAYAVGRVHKGTTTFTVSIPAEIGRSLPRGTYEIDPTTEGELLVFDLTSIIATPVPGFQPVRPVANGAVA